MYRFSTSVVKKSEKISKMEIVGCVDTQSSEDFRRFVDAAIKEDYHNYLLVFPRLNS